jgi:hypothetical protein
MGHGKNKQKSVKTMFSTAIPTDKKLNRQKIKDL